MKSMSTQITVSVLWFTSPATTPMNTFCVQFQSTVSQSKSHFWSAADLGNSTLPWNVCRVVFCQSGKCTMIQGDPWICLYEAGGKDPGWNRKIYRNEADYARKVGILAVNHESQIRVGYNLFDVVIGFLGSIQHCIEATPSVIWRNNTSWTSVLHTSWNKTLFREISHICCQNWEDTTYISICTSHLNALFASIHEKKTMDDMQ